MHRFSRWPASNYVPIVPKTISMNKKSTVTSNMTGSELTMVNTS
jgi:hypothetical protein